uniref:Uncharacterized protein n=1 Tax=Setaria italica TaxID=4555 RepID=K3YWB4_SETIT
MQSSRIIRTAKAGLGSSVGLCISGSSLSKIKSRDGKRHKKDSKTRNKIGEVSTVTQWWQQGYWFDSASESPQFFQKRELNILIATTSPTDEKKRRSPNEKIRRKIANKPENERRNQMARFSGIIGIQINLTYGERPVIWSVELEYYRVVTAITPFED